MDPNTCLKRTKHTLDFVIYCYICRKLQFISYGVTIKSYGVTGRHVTPYDEVSHHMMFSALSTTLSLVATHKHTKNMLAITKQNRFTCNYDKIIKCLLHFYEKCVTPKDIWKWDFCQSANKIWYIVNIKMITHLRLYSRNTLIVLYNLAEEGPLLPKGVKTVARSNIPK